MKTLCVQGSKKRQRGGRILDEGRVTSNEDGELGRSLIMQGL